MYEWFTMFLNHSDNNIIDQKEFIFYMLVRQTFVAILKKMTC